MTFLTGFVTVLGVNGFASVLVNVYARCVLIRRLLFCHWSDLKGIDAAVLYFLPGINETSFVWMFWEDLKIYHVELNPIPRYSLWRIPRLGMKGNRKLIRVTRRDSSPPNKRHDRRKRMMVKMFRMPRGVLL